MKPPVWVKWLSDPSKYYKGSYTFPVMNPLTYEWVIWTPKGKTIVVSDSEYQAWRPKLFATRYD